MVDQSNEHIDIVTQQIDVLSHMKEENMISSNDYIDRVEKLVSEVGIDLQNDIIDEVKNENK